MTPANAPLPIRPPADLVELELVLHVIDRDVRAELEQHEEGRARHDFALDALRIGVLALRQAQGRIDADHVRAEGERVLERLAAALREHRETVAAHVASTLHDYFDPENGRFPERVDRLVRKDGELEQLLRRQVGGADSALALTLDRHVGQGSALAGLPTTLASAVAELLREQRDSFLGEFSLDNEDGALTRLIRQVTENNGALGKDLRERMAEVVREFSLNDDGSALARLKREILRVLDGEREESAKFRAEVRETLLTLDARKKEAARSTRHGHDFEAAVHAFVRDRATRSGDVAEAAGTTAGRIPRCKVGDAVVTLGPEHVAAGARIVVEAKERGNVSLADALAEIATARENREAQVGLFVYSARVAPDGVESFARFGSDVVVVWDAEDPGTDVWLIAGLEVARALCAAASAGLDDERAADLDALEGAISAVEKQAEGLEVIRRLAGSVRNGGQKILDRVASMRDGLARQIGILRDSTERLKQAHDAPAPKRRRGRKS